MVWFSVVIIVLLFYLTGKLLLLKREIRKLNAQMIERTDGETEKMLDISLIDRDLENLAGTLNYYNREQRNVLANAKKHEEYLKESIANISHDLRTPLTVILGHLQLLKKEDLSEAELERVCTISRKAERMKELISNFYELTVLDSEKMVVKKESFNFSNLLINLITDYAPAMNKRNIQPKVILPEYSVFLDSDYGMQERIIQNLLTNAIRYSAGKMKIELSQIQKNHVKLTIENNVENIEEIELEHIFERFYTGDKSRHNESTGLGLAVVKQLVEKMDGKVEAVKYGDILSISVDFD